VLINKYMNFHTIINNLVLLIYVKNKNLMTKKVSGLLVIYFIYLSNIFNK